MPLSIESLIRFPIFPEYFSFRKGKDELPNLWIFLRLKWAPKIISGLWVGIFSECDARWSLRMWVTGALPRAAQDGLQVSLWDLEHIPRWVNWYSALSLWALKVDFMACFASLPSSLKKTKTQKNLWSKDFICSRPTETAEWPVVQCALHSSSQVWGSPEWPSVTTRGA